MKWNYRQATHADLESVMAVILSLSYHEEDYDTLYEGKWLSDLPICSCIATR
ncbi:MAG: hypothetical protein IJS37_03545 [Bacilli bacterium]|nr:hypothetical protein [Bacilli bacterium]